MSLEGEQFQARVRIPDLERLVPAPRDDPLAVGTETHAADTVRVPLEGEQFQARLRIPDLHSLIFAPRDDPLAISADTDAAKPIRVSEQRPLGGTDKSDQVTPLPRRGFFVPAPLFPLLS